MLIEPDKTPSYCHDLLEPCEDQKLPSVIRPHWGLRVDRGFKWWWRQNV